VSFGSWHLRRNEWNVRGARAEVVTSAFLREVSVLSPGTEPTEPLAEVLLFTPSKSAPVARSGRQVAGDVAIDHPPGTKVTSFYAVVSVGGVLVRRK